jgi:transglutaminase-like putative cysteine protease
LPESNLYQEISLENTGGAIDTTRMGNKFIYWDKTYSSGDNVNLNCEYQIEYETYSVRVDLTKIKEIYPYDTESDVYKQNIGSSGDYIVPTHPDIISIASSLWDDSKDILDYAKNCYEYTAANYQYLNPNTGLHKLDKNLQNGGGDCGNLSAIYISLLRNRNIPARPVVCIRPDGSFHVWSEFYLESYGWIPVDVTYKNSDREGNYFGVYSGDCIVVSNEYYVQMTAEDRVFQTPLLQTYAYWYWNMSSMRHSYSIEE